jgi:hypothetical protein
MGDGDQVDVVVHQAIALQCDAIVGQEIGEQLQVEEAVGGTKEDFLAVITALGDVMGNTGQNEAIGPWHQLLSRNLAPKLSVPEVFDTGAMRGL